MRVLRALCAAPRRTRGCAQRSNEALFRELRELPWYARRHRPLLAPTACVPGSLPTRMPAHRPTAVRGAPGGRGGGPGGGAAGADPTAVLQLAGGSRQAAPVPPHGEGYAAPWFAGLVFPAPEQGVLIGRFSGGTELPWVLLTYEDGAWRWEPDLPARRSRSRRRLTRSPARAPRP